MLQELIGRDKKTDLDHLIEYYRLCAQSDGKSPATIAIVVNAIRYLSSFLKKNDLPTNILQIGVREIRSFSLDLQIRQRFVEHPFTKPQQGHLSGHTINGYLRGTRSFWKWLEDEGFIDENPFASLKIPKAPKKIIPTFSAEQLERLIEAIDVSKPQGYRNYAILILLVDTAMRLSELIHLKLDDVNLERRNLKVWGKGSQERPIPFGVRAQRALLRYINFYRPEPANPFTKELFLTHSGEPMKKRRVQLIIQSYGIKAGIKGVRCSPHTLRHTAAVLWIRNGGDPFSLQQILGHSTLDIVRIYVNLGQGDVEAAHRKFSPADNLDLKEPRTRSPK